MKNLKSNLFLLSLLFFALASNAQKEDEAEFYGEEEFKNENPQEIVLGKNAEFRLMMVQKRGGTFHYRLVDQNDLEMFPAIFNGVQIIDENHYLFQMDSYMLLTDNKLKIIREYPYEVFPIQKSDLYHSKNGIFVLNKDFTFSSIFDKIQLDPTFEWSVSENYKDQINGIYTLFHQTKNERDRQYGSRLFDLKTFQFISKSYIQIYGINNFIVGINKNFGEESDVDIMDNTGKVIMRFNSMVRVEFGFLVKDDSNKLGFCDKNFNIILDCNYNDLKFGTEKTKYFNSGYEAGYVYNNGKLIFDSTFYFIASINGKNNLYNQKGLPVLKDSYESIIPLPDGKIIIKKDKKYGLIDFDNKNILPFEYDSVVPLMNRLYLFSNGTWDLYNLKTSKLHDFNWQAVKLLDWNFVEVTKEGKKAILTPSGDVENIEFNLDDYFLGAYKQVIFKQNKKWGILSLRYNKKEIIVKPEYEEIIAFHSSIYRLKKGKVYTLFTNKEGFDDKTYDAIYFTLIYDDFGLGPHEFHCIKGKSTEIKTFKSENWYGM